MTTHYYAENQCQATIKSTGKPCQNKAYYLHNQNKMLLCGVHSKDRRTKLPKNPKAKEVRQKLLVERQALAEFSAERNKKAGRLGYVILSKLRMMKEPEQIDGYLKVFPNFKHAKRPDGFGCATLSPKSMGPIDHRQPGLPIALNLENFHQGNKVFPSETARHDGEIEVLDTFYETQKNMYLDPVPHRHKKEAKSVQGHSGNKNIPVFSLWRRPNGEEIRMTYFESRQFYCTFYERIAPTLPEFQKLVEMINNGYNLQICGYDAYPVVEGMSLEDCYLDISRPFGHELVLYTMLVEIDPTKYPWKKYTTEEF